jgi:hypothetical protein
MGGQVLVKIVPTIKLKLDSPPWRRLQLRIFTFVYKKDPSSDL